VLQETEQLPVLRVGLGRWEIPAVREIPVSQVVPDLLASQVGLVPADSLETPEAEDLLVQWASKVTLETLATLVLQVSSSK